MCALGRSLEEPRQWADMVLSTKLKDLELKPNEEHLVTRGQPREVSDLPAVQASRLGSPRQRRRWECELGLPSSLFWLGVDLGLRQDSSGSCIASTSIATDSTQGLRRKWFS